jgi:glucoside 3-dehydrogenase (cytochrome c) hitch-hiker subunit
MNRRELIKKTSLALGYSISGPTLLGIVGGCEPKHTLAFEPSLFTKEQAIVIGDLADIIIPRTDTPGAKDVGVPAFIENFVKEVYSKEEQGKFIQGIDDYNRSTIGKQFRTFIDCTPDLQRLIVVADNQDAVRKASSVSEGWWNNAKMERPFLLKVKELTILGYFTSKEGATEVLQYSPAPGPYQGCVPLSQVGKAWAT